MGLECFGRDTIRKNIRGKGKMRIEELEEMAYLLESENMMELNKEISAHLKKRGIKLREFKWNELEAS